MAHIPRVANIECFTPTQRHPVARSAEVVEALGRETARVLRMLGGRRAGVRRRRAVAVFAPHSQLVRHERLIRRQRERSGGVAGKTI